MFLVADGTMAAVFEEFLSRPDWSQRLGCAAFDFDPTQDLIVDTLGRDPGVFTRAQQLLNQYRGDYAHAVVVLDSAWSGSPGAVAIERRIARRLHRGWGADGCVVVAIDPELEAWIWQESAALAAVLRFQNALALRDWLAAAGEWPPGQAKPAHPKGAMDRVREFNGITRSAAVYRKIVARSPVDQCTDPAFRRLVAALRAWFPREAL